MNIEQERADFEAWVSTQSVVRKYGAKLHRSSCGNHYKDLRINQRWLAFKAGRAALQSQGPAEQALAELVDKIVPGLDTGDLLADARKASAALGLGAPVSQDREHVPAYRLLEAGEIIQADDEFIANDGVTWSSAGTGLWVGMPYTHALKSARRRIEGEAK